MILNGILHLRWPIVLNFVRAATVIAAFSVFLLLEESFNVHQQKGSAAFAELVRFVRESTAPASRFALMPDRFPFRGDFGAKFSLSSLPNAFAALTKRRILYQDWGYTEMSSDNDIRREFATGLYFSGAARLLYPCEAEIRLPGDLFYLTWTYYSLRRRQKCADFAELISTFDSCQAIREFPVEYVIWDRSLMLPEPSLFATYGREVWQSSDANFVVIQFDAKRAESALCSSAYSPSATHELP